MFQRGLDFTFGEQEATLMSSSEVGGMIRPTTDHHVLGLRMPRAAIAPLLDGADRSIMRRIPRDTAALQLLLRNLYLAMNSRQLLVSLGSAQRADARRFAEVARS